MAPHLNGANRIMKPQSFIAQDYRGRHQSEFSEQPQLVLWGWRAELFRSVENCNNTDDAVVTQHVGTASSFKSVWNTPPSRMMWSS